jgi:hypothetical protein
MIMAAPKGNKYAKGNAGGGRPTLYQRKYAVIAERMCSKGATRADLADRFGVAIATIVSWQLEHEEFSGACKRGQEAADDRVEASYYERAVGYTYDSEKLFMHEGKIIREPLKVHVPPDPRAAEFWLRNRRPDRWKDAKQLETRVADDDPLLAFLKSIDGRVLRPGEQDGQPIDVEYAEAKPEQEGDDGPPRLLEGPRK